MGRSILCAALSQPLPPEEAIVLGPHQQRARSASRLQQLTGRESTGSIATSTSTTGVLLRRKPCLRNAERTLLARLAAVLAELSLMTELLRLLAGPLAVVVGHVSRQGGPPTVHLAAEGAARLAAVHRLVVPQARLGRERLFAAAAAVALHGRQRQRPP